MKTLTSQISWKASISDAGEFEGLASVFGVIDAQGDKVLPGAFRDSLAKRAKVPVLWQHSTVEPIGVGHVEEVREGLLIRGQLALDVPKAKEAHALMKLGAIDGLSIGYTVRDYDFEGGTRVLKAIDLMEISIVTHPANDEARVSLVKEADADEVIERMIAMQIRLAEMRIDAIAAQVPSGIVGSSAAVVVEREYPRIRPSEAPNPHFSTGAW